jgi:hypothetical protein
MEIQKETGWSPYLSKKFLPMRKQYHLRPARRGFDAWDVDKLIEASKDFPVFQVNLEDIKELDENFWYQGENDIPTCRSIGNHIQLTNTADLSFPVILSEELRVMDGMHRILKALTSGQLIISAVRFEQDPPPDFRNVYEDELPY